MLPIIAVFRVGEYDFIYFDISKNQFSDTFTVKPGDDYLLNTYSQITFSEYDEESQMSRSLMTATISRIDNDEDEILKDLTAERLVGIILHVYGELNLDKRSEGQVSTLKH